MPQKLATSKAPKEARKVVRKTASRRGVHDVLGTSQPVTVGMVRSGLHPNVVRKLSKRLHLPTEQTLRIINLSKQTYARRQQSRKLTSEESDRVWRVADIVAKATQLLGDEDAASDWLRSPAPALDGESPLERASTDIGARDVEQLIGRLEYGIPT